MSRHGELSFTGPATFFKAPLLDPGSGQGGHDVACLGVPYDFAVGYRPGARFAPAAVRAASGRLAWPEEGLYDLASDRRRLAGLGLVDLGDVDPLQLDAEATFARITAAARAARKTARLPVFVGGDHSISFPLLQAFDDEHDLHVVQFDAHLDFSDARNGTRLSNSSPFRRAFETSDGLTGRTVVGLRGMRADEEAVAASRELGHRLIRADEVHDSLAEVLARLPRGRRVYVSFDVDCLDPAELPGTSSPEPGGLSFRQLEVLLGAVIEHNELLGLDLTELAPGLDPSGRSELLAARVLAESLAAWWDTAGHR
ncbi:MAG TPA: arginase family protein [Trueperaceae bacterium]|nr:arginase family protein [Trueperaceae bacterium]